MGLGCGTSIVKYILFVFNFLIALGGIALVTVGILALVNINDFGDVFEEHSPVFAAVSVIVFGSIVFLIAFFGCCGAIRESHCLTMTYASVLLVLLIAQVVVAILIFVNQDDFKTNILKVVEKLFQNNPTVAPNRQTIDAIQQATECCGFNGIGDWAGQIPPSCCKGNPSTCLASNAFQSNCRDSVRDFIIQYSNLLSWIAIGVAGIELVALIFACCLGNNIRNAERRYA